MPPPSTKRAPAVLLVLFVVYLGLLTWLILWKLTAPWIGEAAFLPHPVKLIPFFPSGDADASNPLEALANLLFFIPFGVYLGLLAPRWTWWKPAAVFLGASLLLEIAQHLLSVGSFDITDVIMNTAGGFAGLGLLALARRRWGERTAPVLSRVLLVATAVGLIAIAAFVASPLRYAPQHDVVFGLAALR